MSQSQADSPEVRSLREASAGLEYPSESDAPFDVFSWPAAPIKRSIRDVVVANVASGRKVEEVPLDRFFSELEPSEDAERFGRLRQVLVTTLKDVAAFRVGAGERRVDVYLVGRTVTDALAGLHTVSVDT